MVFLYFFAILIASCVGGSSKASTKVDTRKHQEIHLEKEKKSERIDLKKKESLPSKRIDLENKEDPLNPAVKKEEKEQSSPTSLQKDRLKKKKRSSSSRR